MKLLQQAALTVAVCLTVAPLPMAAQTGQDAMVGTISDSTGRTA